MTKHVAVTFDCESTYGMPDSGIAYDFDATVHRLLKLLAKHKVHATFFIVGKLAFDEPKTIQAIHNAGHEIGLHGVAHEHSNRLSDKAFRKFVDDLARAKARVTELTGASPSSFRSPYLSAPIFYDRRLYTALKKLGIKDISNREVRSPQELFVPGRLPFGRALLNWRPLRSSAAIAINANFMRTDILDGRNFIRRLLWTTRPTPFTRAEGLREHPVASPLDCDLLGLPLPSESTTEQLIDFATSALCNDFDAAQHYFNVNCHDWIVGSANRLQVLDRVLSHIRQTDAAFSTLNTIDEAA